MVELFHGDCLEVMDGLVARGVKVGMVLTDPPYQRTQNYWDVAIDFEKMWSRIWMIAKKNACVALFADGMYMADLMTSCRKQWKYNLTWDKVLASGFLNANRMPLRTTEQIYVFYAKQPVYNPQKTLGEKSHSTGKPKKRANNNYGDFAIVDNGEQLGNMKHPTSLLRFPKPHPSKAVHPTEKPVKLLVNLILTYTDEGDTVLDFTMGSGSIGVACVNTKRNFIGIELDGNCFDVAQKRIQTTEIMNSHGGKNND